LAAVSVFDMAAGNLLYLWIFCSGAFGTFHAKIPIIGIVAV
jgi:hypothetical protein